MILALVAVIAVVAGTVWMLPLIQSDKIRKAYVKVQEAESGIDVALTKRYDLLTRSYEIMNEYLDEETKVLKSAIYIHKNMSVEEMSEQDKYMEDLANRIIGVLRDNMELKTNPVFKQILKEIADSEEHLQAARRLYNANVSELNQLICTHRGQKIAEDMDIEPEIFFEANAEKRNSVEFERK